MVRIPCCEKMGLKKGPWTPEEDQILVSYIQRFGHTNWRALPKQAGLLRCGKSCRLRWINYLRPDIKRGNFSPEEEEAIIKLHQVLGNRWSTIAAKLPGRTDNEIKNYWHSHIKKKMIQEKFSTAGRSSNHSSHDHRCTKTISERGMIGDPRLLHTGNLSSTHQTNDNPRHHAVAFPQELPRELLGSTATTVEAAGNGFNAINDMQFWYDLFMKAGSSREMYGN